MGAEYSVLLFQLESRWLSRLLSRDKFLQGVYDLRDKVANFLEEEKGSEADLFRVV